MVGFWSIFMISLEPTLSKILEKIHSLHPAARRRERRPASQKNFLYIFLFFARSPVENFFETQFYLKDIFNSDIFSARSIKSRFKSAIFCSLVAIFFCKSKLKVPSELQGMLIFISKLLIL